jgi:hypothetical protein
LITQDQTSKNFPNLRNDFNELNSKQVLKNENKKNIEEIQNLSNLEKNNPKIEKDEEIPQKLQPKSNIFFYIVLISLFLVVLSVILIIFVKGPVIFKRIILSTENLDLSNITTIASQNKLKLNCGTNLTIASVILEKDQVNENYKYIYECRNITNKIAYEIQEKESQKYSYNSNDSNIKDYLILEKLNVDCGNSSGLIGFNLNLKRENDTNSLYYSYKCAMSSSFKYCSSHRSNFTKVNTTDRSIIKYLADLEISLPQESQVLNAFKLNSFNDNNGELNIYYDFRICEIVVNTTQEVSTINDTTILPLVVMKVDCGEQNAINSFGLVFPNNNSIMYSYSCEKVNSESKTYDVLHEDKYHFSLENDTLNLTDLKKFKYEKGIECDGGYAIQSFNLSYFNDTKNKDNKDTNKFSYDYKCVKLKNDCYSLFRKYVVVDLPEYSKNSSLLNLPKISLLDNQVIRQFKLKKEDFDDHGSKLIYEISYCNLE